MKKILLALALILAAVSTRAAALYSVPESNNMTQIRFVLAVTIDGTNIAKFDLTNLTLKVAFNTATGILGTRISAKLENTNPVVYLDSARAGYYGVKFRNISNDWLNVGFFDSTDAEAMRLRSQGTNGFFDLFDVANDRTVFRYEGTNAFTTWFPPLALSYITPDTVAVFGPNREFTNSPVTRTELGYVAGVTSPIQAQLDSLGSFTATSNALVAQFVGNDTITSNGVIAVLVANDATTSNALRTLLIGNDTLTSNGVVTMLIANDTTTSNGVVTLLVANDTTTSNALRTLLIASDTTTSNGVVTLLIANDTVTSNGVVTLLAANDAITSNALRTLLIANDTVTSNALWAAKLDALNGIATNLTTRSVTGSPSNAFTASLTNGNPGLVQDSNGVVRVYSQWINANSNAGFQITITNGVTRLASFSVGAGVTNQDMVFAAQDGKYPALILHTNGSVEIGANGTTVFSTSGTITSSADAQFSSIQFGNGRGIFYSGFDGVARLTGSGSQRSSALIFGDATSSPGSNAPALAMINANSNFLSVVKSGGASITWAGTYTNPVLYGFLAAQIGIGITNPAVTLDVAGVVRAQGVILSNINGSASTALLTNVTLATNVGVYVFDSSSGSNLTATLPTNTTVMNGQPWEIVLGSEGTNFLNITPTTFSSGTADKINRSTNWIITPGMTVKLQKQGTNYTIVSGAPSVPIGNKAFFEKDFIGVCPTLASWYVECNGQVLSDASSPLNGQTMPDDNTANRFPRGSTTSGGTGGVESHTHVGTTDADLVNVTQVSTASGTEISLSSHVHTFNTDPAASLPPYKNVVYYMRVK